MMNSRRLIAGLITASVILPLGAEASKRNAAEAMVNESQIARDIAQLTRDRSEVAAFERALVQLRTSLAEMDKGDAVSACGQLRTAMKRELEQSRAKVRQANREVGQSRREVRDEREESNATGRAIDYIQAADDRRDVRDDRRDRADTTARSEEMAGLVRRSDALEEAANRGNLDAIEKIERIAEQFLALMRADVSATAGELVEDRGERREDRRERVTDRRK